MMCNGPEAKAALRRLIEKEGRALSSAERQSGDAAMTAHLLSLPEYQSARRIFCFYSVGFEPDTHCFMARALEDGKELALPVSLPRGVLRFYRVHSLDDLVPGVYGIPAPSTEGEEVTAAPDDLAVVPCVASDRMGRRLGHGGGYYDRWLALNPVFSALLCRERFVRDEVPLEPFDRQADCLITEKGVVRYRA